MTEQTRRNEAYLQRGVNPVATNEGKSDLFYPRELNSFETGLLLVRSARWRTSRTGRFTCTLRRMFEEKTGALLGGGG